MPKQYEEMRDSFESKGMSDKAAKTKAAKIYNSTHHSNPVTSHDHAMHDSPQESAEGEPSPLFKDMTSQIEHAN
jgi:hypothetical protein